LGFSFSPLQSGRGEWIGLIAVCRDLTEIKRMEERVRQADRLAALGRLSANMAHEIRNPLASLSGSIELLAQERGTDEARAGLTEIVLRESERLNQIIADFLAYARPTLPQRHPADLAQVLDEVLDQLERREGTTVKLRREYPSALPALVDGQQVRQAVWHLCTAAIDAMGGDGELLVGARNGDRIELWVSDTAPRIPPEELAHLFEPFASSRGGSTGLGLALVHRIVGDHGGEVEVRSRPEGGTTVLLAFPRG
jgi:two-component system sensor histidine kinase PilS (NtrC family)